MTFSSYRYIYETHAKGNPHVKSNPHTKHIKSVKGHVFDIKFLNSNAEMTFRPSGKQDFYHNYFLGDKRSWASEVVFISISCL